MALPHEPSQRGTEHHLLDTRSTSSYGDRVTTSPDPSAGQQHDQGTDRGDQTPRNDQLTGHSGEGSGQQPAPGGETGQSPQYPGGQAGPQPYPNYAYGQYPVYGQYPGQQPGAGQPYPYGGQQPGAYPYSPYGANFPTGQTPAGLGAQGPVGRPGVMILALILLLFSTLPPLLFGVSMVVIQLDPSQLPPGLEAALNAQGVTLEQLFAVMRVVGWVTVMLALLFSLMAVLAFLGNTGARIVLTVLTCLFSVVLLFFVASSIAAPGLAISFLVILAASVAGTILLYSRPAAVYYAARQR